MNRSVLWVLRRGCLVALATFLVLFMSALPAAAKKLNVVTSTTDMASLAQEVGGDNVVVDSIARGYQDPHFVEAKPSFLLKLKQADLLVVVGLQLEIGWLPPLITQSGNPRIQTGATGYLDASQFADILDVPTGPVTRAMGDVHPLGNPHYWLDPNNGRRIAKGIANKLAEMDPPNAATYQQRFQDFDKRLSAAQQKWDTEMKPFRGTQGRHLSQFLAELRPSLWAQCHRIRRTATGYPPYTESYHRTHGANETGKLQNNNGRTIFSTRKTPIRSLAKLVGRWSSTCHRLAAKRK